MHRVVIRNRILRKIEALLTRIQERFRLLVEDLREKGPVVGNWSNFSKLGEATFHCHLAYRHVACWTCDTKSRQIEVYYVGSRKDAPY